VITQHHRLLNSNGKLFYPLQTPEMRSFNISSGTQVVTSENLFRANLPQFVIVTFIDSSAFAGNITKSPFTFVHNNIQKIKLSADGEKNTIYREVDMDFDNNTILQAYSTLQGLLEDDELGVPFSIQKFKTENFFVMLELIPTTVPHSLLPIRHGQLQLELKFKNPLTSTITCLVMGMFQSVLVIDKQKTVTVESMGN